MMPAHFREWLLASYPTAVVRRFWALELLDRSFGLAAQAFVALLPLVIVLVSVLIGSPDEFIAGNVSDRFGLDTPARTAMQLLFQAPATVKSVSWLAVLMSVLSAFALSRRLSRVYASILGRPSLQRNQLWRGMVWILVQLSLFVAASELRAIRRGGGVLVTLLAIIVLLLVWFVADVASLRLLVPSVPRSVLIPSAVVCGIGRIGLAGWAAVYMPKSLSEQATQYGPIGVTFSFFTFILASVLVYVCAPLLVVTWTRWRDERKAPALASE